MSASPSVPSSARPPSSRRRLVALVLVLPLLLAGFVSLDPVARPAAADDVVQRPPDGQVNVSGRGFGHGRGLSQYGAYGAALQGLTHRQILGFYYASTGIGTTAVTQRRVLLTAEDADLVVTNVPGLRVTDAATGAVIDLGQYAGTWGRVRIGVDAGGLYVQGDAGGGQWVTLGNPAWPGNRTPGPLTLSGASPLWLWTPSGAVSPYRGQLTATRSGQATKPLYVVNTVGMQDYLRSVVPSEMPASWHLEALKAQAVAARSYGAQQCPQGGTYPATWAYDVVDTVACQVYRGMGVEQPRSTSAVDATSGEVVTYAGTTLRTEFSASNGGWTVATSHPAFVARADPYDAIGTGAAGTTDSVHRWADQRRNMADLESRYALGTLREMRVVQRDGNGEWGGRVLNVQLVGTSRTVNVTGDAIRSAWSLRSNWFDVRPVVAPPSAPGQVAADPAPGAVSTWWTPGEGGGPVDHWWVSLQPGNRVAKLPAGTREYLFDGLDLNTAYTVTVTAEGPGGASAPKQGPTVVPGPELGEYVPLDRPHRLLDSRTEGAAGRLAPGTTRLVGVAGKGPVPGSATAAVLSVVAVGTSREGNVSVWPAGYVQPPTSNVNWTTAETVTASVFADLGALGAVYLRSQGDSPYVVVDVVGYVTPQPGGGQRYTALDRPSRVYDTRPIARPFSTPQETRAIPLAGRGGVPAGARGVLTTATAVGVTAPDTHLRLWPTGQPPAPTSVLTMQRGDTRAVTAPVAPGTGGQVTAYVATPSTHLVLDATGWWGDAGSRFSPLFPRRVVDTRSGLGGGALTNGGELVVDARAAGAPANATDVVLNLTAPRGSGTGYLQAWDGQGAAPATSVLNTMPNRTTANVAVVPIGPDGTVRIRYASDGPSRHLVADVQGFFAP
ncbi:SpoIID/LytB domain-containing protein [Thalassiella azotivora]